MEPKDFLTNPWNSVLQNNECETTAFNIMAILSRTGNKWRTLSWDEYAAERAKDGPVGNERPSFDRVVEYCVTAESAKAFSTGWANIVVD
jgi:hypothetical protein